VEGGRLEPGLADVGVLADYGCAVVVVASVAPALGVQPHSLRRLFQFGSFMMISGLLDTLYLRIYAVLIGKLFSARDLGFYTRAESTQQLRRLF